jgi:hypothetical protein
MTTSGVYSFTRNRNQIITAALRIVGAVETGQPVYPEQIEDTAEALNIFIKAISPEIGGLWAIAEVVIPLTVTDKYYLLGPSSVPAIPKPLDIIEARRRDAYGNDTPLTPCNRDDYMILSDKSSLGIVNQYYYQPTLINGLLYVWPVSALATDSIVLSAKIPFQDFVSMPDNADFPPEALRMLKWGLADEIALEFSVDTQKRSEIKEKAKEYKELFKFHDTEVSFNFAPEFRR